MDALLRDISVNIHEICHGNSLCSDCNHVFLIEKYYEDLIEVMAKCDGCLPRKNSYCTNDFWNEELYRLKQLFKSYGIPWVGLTTAHFMKVKDDLIILTSTH